MSLGEICQPIVVVLFVFFTCYQAVARNCEMAALGSRVAEKGYVLGQAMERSERASIIELKELVEKHGEKGAQAWKVYDARLERPGHGVLEHQGVSRSVLDVLKDDAEFSLLHREVNDMVKEADLLAPQGMRAILSVLNIHVLRAGIAAGNTGSLHTDYKGHIGAARTLLPVEGRLTTRYVDKADLVPVNNRREIDRSQFERFGHDLKVHKEDIRTVPADKTLYFLTEGSKEVYGTGAQATVHGGAVKTLRETPEDRVALVAAIRFVSAADYAHLTASN